MSENEIKDIIDQCRVFRKCGEYERSLNIANAALLRSEDPRLFYSRALTLDGMQEPQKAVEDLTQAIEGDPINALYYFDRGCIRAFPLDRHVAAVEDFEKVIELNPAHIEAYRQCCGSLLVMGKPSRALQFAEQALQFAPDDASTFYYIGECLFSLARYREAETQFAIAIKLDPSHPLYKSSLARVRERGTDRRGNRGEETGTQTV